MSTTFVELCAGSAAVTLRLLGGKHAKPPVGYQGSKRAFASSILRTMGLQEGQHVDQLVLVEPGPWASVLEALSQGRAQQLVGLMEPWCVPDADAQRATFARLRDLLLADRLRADDEAAAWLWCLTRSYGARTDLAFIPLWVAGRIGSGLTEWRYKADDPMPALLELAGLRWPPTTVLRDRAQGLRPGELWRGATVYIDPPYRGTTGYLDGHLFAPEQVEATARRWHEHGCRVFVSEYVRAVPGWPVYRVDRERAHNWSGRTNQEYLTASPGAVSS